MISQYKRDELKLMWRSIAGDRSVLNTAGKILFLPIIVFAIAMFGLVIILFTKDPS